MANKILHTTIMQKNSSGGKNIIYPKTVTKNIIDGSSTLDQTLNILKSPDMSTKTTTFTEASKCENLVSGETLATSHGKIKKLISDLKSLAYTDTVGVSNLDSTLAAAYNERITTDKITTSTSITSDGYVADARAVNNLQNQINTVASNIGYIRYKQYACETDDYMNELKTRFISDEFTVGYVYYLRFSTKTGVWFTVLGYKNGTNRAHLSVMNYFGVNKFLYLNDKGWTEEDIVTNSNLKLPYVEGTYKVTANTMLNLTTATTELIGGTNAPNSSGYIPVVVGHNITSNVLENIMYDTDGTWRYYGTTSQNVAIRFYKVL